MARFWQVCVCICTEVQCLIHHENTTTSEEMHGESLEQREEHVYLYQKTKIHIFLNFY